MKLFIDTGSVAEVEERLAPSVVTRVVAVR